jgi:hypothetical protein
MTNTIDSLMTLVDELEYAAREEAHECAGAYEVNALIAARKALDAALAETQRDAKRYRWLRSSDNWPELMDGVDAAIICGYAGHEDLLSDSQLDNAIDAAMEGAA